MKEVSIDESKSIEHTQLKPLTIALAVSDDYKMLGVKVDIMHRLEQGAHAVQMRTAFLACQEAGTAEPYKALWSKTGSGDLWTQSAASFINTLF
ncbi:MAG: hypothetical protein JNL11_09490 [Bdellovibrionaceae bacterium]|nr:hypothetical protein [Pseudobdellovibrionaceae bacterium]